VSDGTARSSFDVKVVRLSANEIVWRIARAVGLVAAPFDGKWCSGLVTDRSGAVSY